jgi:Transposase IS66 family
VVFDFRLSRGRDGPKRFLGQFEGILQTDGYAAYDQIGGPRMVHAACWAHARRQFFEAVQLNPRDPVATPIVAQMDELFAVDAEARPKTLKIAARHMRRQETARALLGNLWISSRGRKVIGLGTQFTEAYAGPISTKVIHDPGFLSTRLPPSSAWEGRIELTSYCGKFMRRSRPWKRGSERRKSQSQATPR